MILCGIIVKDFEIKCIFSNFERKFIVVKNKKHLDSVTISAIKQ